MKKKQFTIYKLHFTSPLHISNSRDDYSVSLQSVNSDTLYAAITSCLAKLGKKVPDNGDLGCTISCLFPFYQKDAQSDTILFLPKPLFSKQPNLKDVADAKKVKKVKWLDPFFFEKAINGESLFDQSKDIECIYGQYASKALVNSKFISSQVSQRVSVSRTMKEDAKPFYMDRVIFSDYSGLYFLCEGDTTLIEEGMNILQWEGIGTDRNVGNGFFQYEKSSLDISLPDNGSHVMALSLFIPESNEQWTEMTNDEKIAYDIERRGGWITSPPNNTIRKNAIYGISAGSVFKKLKDDCYTAGLIVDLRPNIPMVDHPVWRCGRSLFIPIK